MDRRSAAPLPVFATRVFLAKWESEKEIADSLRDLTAKVRKLQDEIRGDALSSRRQREPHLPLAEDHRIRSIVAHPRPRTKPDND